MVIAVTLPGVGHARYGAVTMLGVGHAQYGKGR